LTLGRVSFFLQIVQSLQSHGIIDVKNREKHG